MPTDNTVFTVVLAPGTDSYTFTQYKTLADGSGVSVSTTGRLVVGSFPAVLLRKGARKAIRRCTRRATWDSADLLDNDAAEQGPA